jgi:hypothetical protein
MLGRQLYCHPERVRQCNYRTNLVIEENVTNRMPSP